VSITSIQDPPVSVPKAPDISNYPHLRGTEEEKKALQAALDVLAETCAANKFLSALETRGTIITFSGSDSLEEAGDPVYYPSTNTISIPQAFSRTAPEVLAAVIAIEGTHASQAPDIPGVGTMLFHWAQTGAWLLGLSWYDDLEVDMVLDAAAIWRELQADHPELADPALRQGDTGAARIANAMDLMAAAADGGEEGARAAVESKYETLPDLVNKGIRDFTAWVSPTVGESPNN
jgi:hypothetical protein